MLLSYTGIVGGLSLVNVPQREPVVYTVIMRRHHATDAARSIRVFLEIVQYVVLVSTH